ncbi:hydroxyisourate hydrolase [Microvirga mediterraneensis]|uniref:5-hydroxyisourate hydrolase n=1 Tax=Microvirga mediterraneensis TaxID=2754695 RepID=A0A838BMF0_9HYPH|nr:hydroxyisourate hydrolase [Microvirga mediterraneensis]MBA1156521.1 hydroxyisourate hydrolase [Microvirga mediterraneensis]
MGRLSTHVLDTANGRPARGVAIELFSLEGEQRRSIARTVTNADGRTDAPLMTGEAFRTGTYELVFSVGAYFKALGTATADPPFLDTVPIRFSLAEPDGHYHVPLLVSPWSYSTYRGS